MAQPKQQQQQQQQTIVRKTERVGGGGGGEEGRVLMTIELELTRRNGEEGPGGEGGGGPGRSKPLSLLSRLANQLTLKQ